MPNNPSGFVMIASTTLRLSGCKTSLALLPFLLIILAGCARPPEPMKSAPDFVGFVTQIMPGENNRQPDRVVVENHADKVVTRFVIPIGPDTPLFHYVAGDTNPADFENLSRQQWVHVWFADELIDDEAEIRRASQITFFDPEDREGVFGGIGTLSGNVSIGPLQPVQREGVAQATPMPEVYTSRTIVVYEEDGQTEVKRVPVQPDGTYDIRLFAGNYVVDIGRSGIDSAADLPKTVHINGGQVTQLDIDIDTGIR
jgi:hypothetical protein